MMTLTEQTIECCETTYDELWDTYLLRHGFEIRHQDSLDRYAIRIGSPDYVVGVCHGDTVLSDNLVHHAGDIIVSPELDDRLGLAMHLWIGRQIPSYEPQPTIIVCDNEEIGQSTADVACDELMALSPNWIYEFDRRGTDAVLYDYECDLWKGIVSQYFPDIGNGSFSDISRMESLKVKGVNIGCGYHREHTRECYADITDARTQCVRFMSMLSALGNIRLPHENRWEQYRSTYKSKYTTYPAKPKPETKVWSIWDNPGEDGDDWREDESDTFLDDDEVQCDGCGKWESPEDLGTSHGIADLCSECRDLLETI